jgi:hypothetical protein
MRTTGAIFAVLALAVGCQRHSPDPGSPVAGGPKAAPGQPADASAAPEASAAPADVAVLSEEDAEIIAASEITAENADAEFDRLMGEIEREATGDPGGTQP